MHEKLIEMILKVQMDDLTDAKMLIEYAEDAKTLGAINLANSFAARAKTRLNNMSECENTLHNMLREHDDDSGLFSRLYHRYITAEHEHIKKKIDAF
jgi:hypothetical protein